MPRRGFGNAYGPTNATVARDPNTGTCPPGYKPISDTTCGPIAASDVTSTALPPVSAAGEPLLKTPNVISAALTVGALALGFKKVALVGLVLNGLDIVARQVSPDYRRMTNIKSPPVAGLGFIPAIRNLDWR